MVRVDWHRYFMNIAVQAATRSTCPRKHVGAVIVRDKTILSTGYNGSIRGYAHCEDVGCLMEDGHCVATVTKALERVPGVESAEASLEKREAVVTGRADARALINALQDEGYEAALLRAEGEPDAFPAASTGEGVMETHRQPDAQGFPRHGQIRAGGQAGARAMLAWLRWPVALAVIGFWVWVLVDHVSMPLMAYSLPFEEWYGNWRDVFIVSAVFLVFVLGFVWPQGRAEWRNAGMYSAFLISLFVEMFGVPLTIFLVAPLIDVPALEFGLSESHLWAYLLDQAQVAPLDWGVYFVMTVSLALIATGMALVAMGWTQVFGTRYRLVTTGIYRIVRHPQYLGLILVIVAFNIQWPTILTLAMAPVLIVTYVRQARREDKELEARFGEAFVDYTLRVPAFIPRLRACRAHRAKGASVMRAPNPSREGAARDKAE